MSFIEIYDARELWVGEMIGLAVAGQKVLLLNVDGEIHAYEDRCAHQAVPLSTGELKGCKLRCGAHHWEFDARTGCGINPKAARLKKLAVRCENDAVYVDLERGTAHAR